MSQNEQDFVVLQDADLADFNPAGLLPQPPDVINRILSWLDPTDYAAESSEYNKHLASYVSGTGTWIQESDQYREWLHSSDQGALWIKATAGVGKSVVAAHTGSLLAKDNIPILSFFFRQIISANRTPQALIRDWLAQLLIFSPALQKRLKDLLDQGRSLESVALDELWEIAVSAISGCPRTYCIVDAIDEMDGGNDDFMQKLVRLGSAKPSSIKLLVTSRPLPHIEKALARPSVIQLPLSPPRVDGDIAIYIKERLDQTNFPSEARKAIVQWLGSKSQGLFLYARLMLDEIAHPGFSDMESLNNSLRRLPNGLGEMYADMLLNHSARSGTPQDLQLFILKCVTHSSRPLRLLELSTLVDFVRKSPRARFAPEVPSSKQGTKHIVREACGPLLEILEDETVSIIHHSLTEFLTDVTTVPASGGTFKFPPIESQDAHLEIAITCVDYLLSDGLSDWPSIEETTEDLDSRINVARLKHPFLDYATKYWTYHVLMYEDADDELFKLLDIFLDTKSTLFCSYLSFKHPNISANKTSALHIAADNGLVAYTKHLLEESHDINFLGIKSRTPLHLAAKGGFDGVVEQLLAYGCDKSMDDYAGYTPIHLAALRNHPKAVSALLKSGVDPLTKRTRDHPGNWCGNARRHTGITALQYVCEYGHTQAAREFLPYVDDESLTSALLWAIQYGKSETAVMIIDETKVDVNRAVGFDSPIHFAAWSHDLISIRKLVAHGADVKLKLGELNSRIYMSIRDHGPVMKSTPLQTFAQFASGYPVPLKKSPEDSFEILKIFVEAGCDLNEVDSHGRTAFHSILGRCGQMDSKTSQKFIQYMFDNGADPSVVTEDGSTALHLVPSNLHGVIESLVSGGMDVNSRKSSDGKTPLFGAIGNADDISAYINLGADCNAQDLKGDTVLHLSVQGRGNSYGPEKPAKLAAIKTLLEAGADLKLKNKSGLTPIHNAALQHKDILLLFVDAGADLESRTDDGLTVLLWALKSWGHGSGFQDLIDIGADVNARDFKGRTVLHYCCGKENGVEHLCELVKAGADPKTRDYDGNTLFHEVSRQHPSYHASQQLALLEALLEFGVSPQSVNNAGQTPLHIAAGTRALGGGHKTDPYEFLLGPKCNSDINASDNAGIRPIHLASTHGESQVKKLLKNGADPMALTIEGQSILHVASRSRQSNAVGLIVDLYLKLGQPQMIDRVDKDGRTALHYAARSGRPESVSTLINLGHANPNLKDGKGITPLGMCAYIREENNYWSPAFTVGHDAYISAAGVTLNDPCRPRFSSDRESGELGIGSYEIIKFLIAHGADVSLMHKKDWRIHSNWDSSPFWEAINNDCEVLVDELLQVEALNSAKTASQETGSEEPGQSSESGDDDDIATWLYNKNPYDNFQESFVTFRIRNADLLEGFVKPGENNITLFRRLLRTEHERGIERFKALGADMLKPEWDGESCITLMVKGGYATMLEKFGVEVATMDDSWIQATEKTNVNLPGRLQAPLTIACGREAPNLEVVKVLVGKFKVDVNAKIYKNNRVAFDNEGSTALHLLATGAHWWNSHALDYLLENGADHNISDKDGNTPLHIAAAKGCFPAAQNLLRHGADPSAINNDGLTCLNKASSNVEIVHLLIENGANLSIGAKPFIFSCIEAKDLRTVKLLAMMGADFNVRSPPVERPETPDGDDFHNSNFWKRYEYDRREAAESSFPVHFSASTRFNTQNSKAKMIPIIEALLNGGADPMLKFNEDGDPILHDICERDGILEPFFFIEGLDLEARDSKGRTLLLAACATAEDWSRGTDSEWRNSQPSKMQMLIDHGANIFAVDNEGRNLLYHLLTKSTNNYLSPARARHPDDLKNILAHNQVSKLVNHKDNSGTTPLQHALKIGDLRSINQLLGAINPLLGEDIANPAEPDIDGNTPLHHLAAQFNDFEQIEEYTVPLIKTFIDLGVDINAANPLGETAIFLLIVNSEVVVEHLKLFEGYGASLTVVNKKGQGLLHAAAKVSSKPIFEYLMEKGLDPMVEDDEMRSALDFATASDCSDILDMFKRER